jgi:glycosyltransferase involved in cell wall biosynthesis
MLKEIVSADAIVCVSEATRRDVLEFYDVSESRVHTVLSGLADDAIQAEDLAGLPPRYLLFVSTIEPRKNVKLLLDAFEHLLDDGGYDGDLVLVGKIGWKSEDVVRRLATSRWLHRIHHLDYLRRAELESVYEKAEIFVFPSIYEGFGFPLLEAMKHGVPSIASRASSLPEVGGDAALYVDPRSEGELAAAIRALAASPELKSELAAKGRERAEQFKWSDTAERTVEILRQVARR